MSGVGKIVNEKTFLAQISFALIALLLITSCGNWKPLATAPFEKEVVKRIFFSLMEIAEEKYGIVPIDNLKHPQPIKDFVRSFRSPALFKKNLEEAFIKNGYSYSKTLNEAARDGLNIIMDRDGGAGMVVLLTMPAKGLKRRELDTIFAGQELKDFEAALGLVDRYLCCPLFDDF